MEKSIINYKKHIFAPPLLALAFLQTAYASSYEIFILDNIEAHIKPHIKSAEIKSFLSKNKPPLSSSLTIDEQNKAWKKELRTDEYKMIPQILLSDMSFKLKKLKEKQRSLICGITLMDKNGYYLAFAHPSGYYHKPFSVNGEIRKKTDTYDIYVEDVFFDTATQCYTRKTNLYIKEKEGYIGILSILYDANEIERQLLKKERIYD